MLGVALVLQSLVLLISMQQLPIRFHRTLNSPRSSIGAINSWTYSGGTDISVGMNLNQDTRNACGG